MSLEFSAEPDPGHGRLVEVAGLAPWNPFYTPPFVAARRALGFEAWVLGLSERGRLVCACTAFLKSGRLGRRLVVQSVPDLAGAETFWNGLGTMCRQQRITELEIHSFGSRHARVPRLGHERGRRVRTEYVLDLHDGDLGSAYSSNHRRNIRRAQKAGVTIETVSDHEACARHAELIRMSMQRRLARGEAVNDDGGVGSFVPYVESGAGSLFQATRDGQVLSSILVLRALLGGYYHSAGSSPAGMESGASHLLISHVIERLRAEGAIEFNLGGAGDDDGLTRFKSGFGTKARSLEAVEFFLGSRLSRTMVDLLADVRNDPTSLLRRTWGRLRSQPTTRPRGA